MAADPSIITRDLNNLAKDTRNLYESVSIISKRARQISAQVKEELSSKLAEFATTVDNLEEIFENREQIEISKFYEKLPNAAIIAMNEYLEDKLDVRERVKDSDEESI